jgi:hypothetical protein
MSNGNEEIVRRFVDSKAIDFKAIGSLVTDLSPKLAVAELGAKVVLVGRHFIIACMMPPALAGDIVGQISKGQIGAAMKE